jgi:hypothetical protein
VRAGRPVSRRLDALRDRLDRVAQVAEPVAQKVERRPGGFGRLRRGLEQTVDVVDALANDA